MPKGMGSAQDSTRGSILAYQGYTRFEGYMGSLVALLVADFDTSVRFWVDYIILYTGTHLSLKFWPGKICCSNGKARD